MSIPNLLRRDDQATQPLTFWALDPRLPRIAAQAAVEFDWLVQMKRGVRPVANPSHESIATLWQLLSHTIGETQIESDKKRLTDSLELNLFAKAYNQNNDQPVKTLDGLIGAIRQLTETLEKAQHKDKEIDENVLEKTRDFCVALSDYASSYREMIYGSRTKHPYRK